MFFLSNRKIPLGINRVIRRLKWFHQHPVIRCMATAQLKLKTSDKLLLEKFYPGKKIHGFLVKQIQEVPELCLTAVRLQHEKTAADYLHIHRDDRNNFFCVTFRTVPMDDTGVPHILEHNVLCGSQKYPVRDPFFKMLTRSLATFMNAFTSCDFTTYPFSTQNPQDFRNLMSVYTDAVFFPCLRELDFRQEGWRLEHEVAEDKSSPIIFKGVVFNEMKGAYTNSEQVFARHLQSHLLPSHTYSYAFGGDPHCIPDLTWQQLKKFHSVHYHPTNSRFYTYGNFPLEDHLQWLNEVVLDKFHKIDIDTTVPEEKRWTEPRTVNISCRPDPLLPNPEKHTTVSISYLLGSITDPFETFVMQILSELLINGPNSSFYKVLLEPNIGSNYAPCSGYDANIKEGKFSVGLQGIYPEDVEKVTKIIEKTWDDVIRNGFENEHIEAILHKIELSLKHQTSNFGMHLAMALLPSWNHDGDPVEFLQVNKLVERFRNCLKENPKFLEDQIIKYFKNNNHKLTFIMKPNKDYEKEEMEKENMKLKDKLQGANTEGIYESGLELAEMQNKKEDLSCLPTLKLTDITSVIKPVKVDKHLLGHTPVFACCQPTNGVTYFRSVLNTSHLPNELKIHLPLFSEVLTRLGAGNMDYKQLDQQIDLKTGGLYVNTHVVDHHTDFGLFEEGIKLESYCLDKNTDDMLNIWSELFNRTHFKDTDRLATLIKMYSTDLVQSISDAGHKYAMTSASSSLSSSSALREQFNGMKQVKQMKTLAELKDVDFLMNTLKQIADSVLTSNSSRFSVNTVPDNMQSVLKKMEMFVSQLPFHDRLSTKEISTINPCSDRRCHYVLPFPVNFVSKCFAVVPYSHPYFASLRVLAQLMSSKFLLREVREKGGAYGGGAVLSPSAVFMFYSYRDPNCLETLNTFDNAIHWAKNGEFLDEEIDEAKISVFQQVDKPLAPGDEGERLFLTGVSDEMFQNHREKLFAVSRENLVDVTEKYLLENPQHGTCVLGPSNEKIRVDNSWVLLQEN